MGTLYVIATPIGNLSDLSPRARETLAAVDCVAAEDTRRTGRLLASLGIQADLVSYHDHNESGRTSQLLNRLAKGEDIGLVSDAGTPLISDPGYRLVKEASDAGFAVVPIVGPSAVIAALSVCGLPVSAFTFIGFLPRKGINKSVEALRNDRRTLVFYESPNRITDTLALFAEVFGANRLACVGRELTKLHEQVTRGTLTELHQALVAGDVPSRGEFVVVVAGAPSVEAELDDRTLQLLQMLSDEMPGKKAAEIVAKLTDIPRKTLYDEIVRMKNHT